MLRLLLAVVVTMSGAVHQSDRRSADPLVEQSEVFVVGAFLAAKPEHRDLLVRATAELEPRMFTQSELRPMFTAARTVLQRGEPVDPVTLSEELKSQGALEEAGGLNAISRLIDAVPTAANVEYHVRTVRERYARSRIREIGQAIVRASENGEEPDAILAEATDLLRTEQGHADRGVRLLTEDEVQATTPSTPLIGDLIYTGTLGVLFGPPESGKSFLLLDWAEHVSRGQRWRGWDVLSGPVVYVYAEGRGGLGARVHAWRSYHQIQEPGPLRFVTEPVELMDSRATYRFLRALDTLEAPPVLVIFDTLARCMLGGDENSSTDMGLFVRGADIVREETGATVLIAHHTNANGDRERGSTALRGAADTVIKLQAEGRTRTLRCEKQKDAAPFKALDFQLTGHEESAVVTPLELHGVKGIYLTPVDLEILQSLHSAAMEEGLTATAWREVADAPESTFYKTRKTLFTKGLVDRDKAGRGAHYVVTKRGVEVVEGLTP